MNWYEVIQYTKIEKILSDCGHTLKKKRFKDCPACGASRTKKDSRPPVGVVGVDRWHCNSCQTEGNKFDLISYYLHGCCASDLDDFRVLKTYVNAVETSPKKAKPIEVIPPPEYPPIDEVNYVLKRGVKFLRDVNTTTKLSEFLKTRGLDKMKIPCGLANPYWGGWDDLSEVQASNNKMTRWFPRLWAREYGLVFPLVDHLGRIRSLLGRTWYKTTRKTTVPISYTTKGLLLANHKAREWMKTKEFQREVLICEGEMDYATACQEWDGLVIGVRSGSIDVCSLLPWAEGMNVYISTDNDLVGDKYARKLSSLVGKAEPLRVKFGGNHE